MEYEIHPFAELLPMIPDEELQEMAADIKEHGQRLNIVTVNNKIIDGRNRLKACGIAGITPRFRDASGELKDEAAIMRFIFSMNMKRRHLDANKRAILAVQLLEVSLNKKKIAAAKAAIEASEAKATIAGPVATEQVPATEQTPAEAAAAVVDVPKDIGKTQLVNEIAKAANVSPAYVHQAEEIKKKDPALYEEIVKGDKTISEARKEMKEDEGKGKKKTKKKLTDDDIEKKAYKIVDKAQAALEELGWSLVDTKIEKL